MGIDQTAMARGQSGDIRRRRRLPDIGGAAHLGTLRKFRRVIEELERSRSFSVVRRDSAGGCHKRRQVQIARDDQAPARFQPRARLP